MINENTQVYIFLSPIAHGFIPTGKVKKICNPTRKEYRFFMDDALEIEDEKALSENQITFITPDKWLKDHVAHPIMNYSSEANAIVAKKAKEYLIDSGIVDDPAELDKIDNTISLFNYYRINYIVYFIDSETKKVIKKK